jgi:serine/threonine protein kinase
MPGPEDQAGPHTLPDTDSSLMGISAVHPPTLRGEPVDRSLAPSHPRQIGLYVIIDLIGRGGMGVVYKARHPTLDRLVAIKVLPGATFNCPEAAARLMREARIGARLGHPSICQILDAGQEGGDFYFVMEYLEGTDLSRVIGEQGPLPVRRACGLACQLMEALEFLAGHNIVHRDIKPSNLMIAANDRLKLLDLGLAKDLNQVRDGSVVTMSGQLMGTPAYMAPEQIMSSNRVSPQADIYGAGATLYEMLTGRRVVQAEGKGVGEVMLRAMQDETPDPRGSRADVPEALARLNMRMLAKKPEDRPAHRMIIDLLKGIAVDAAETVGRPPSPSVVAPPSLPTPAPQADLGNRTLGVTTRPPTPTLTTRPTPFPSPQPTPPPAVPDIWKHGSGIRPPAAPRSSSHAALRNVSLISLLGLLILAGVIYFMRPSGLSVLFTLAGWILAGVGIAVIGVIAFLLSVRLSSRRTQEPRPGSTLGVSSTDPTSRPPPIPAVPEPSLPAPVLPAEVLIPPRPVPPAAPQESDSRAFLQAKLNEVKDHLKDIDSDKLLNLLPKLEGRPCAGIYVLEQCVGSRQAAVHTYRATHAESGLHYIVRLLPAATRELVPEKIKRLKELRGKLMQVSAVCPHLTRLLTVEPTHLVQGTFKKIYFTVEDYVDGQPLEKSIERGEPLDGYWARDLLNQASIALNALHEKNIIHNNLHAGKFYVHARDQAEARRLKLSDLSHACEAAAAVPGALGDHAWNDADVHGNNSAKRRRYLPGEVLLRERAPDQLSEQYGLGVLFIELLRGRAIRHHANPDRQAHYAKEDLENYLEDIMPSVPKLGEILKRMVRLTPEKRFPSLPEINKALARLPTLKKVRKQKQFAGAPFKPEEGAPPPMKPASAPSAVDEGAPPPQSPIAPGGVRAGASSGDTAQAIKSSGTVHEKEPPLVTQFMPPGKLTFEQKSALVTMISALASASGSGAEDFFDGLLRGVNLPPEWRTELMPIRKHSATLAAQKLLDFADFHRINNAEPTCTTVGTILCGLLPHLDLERASAVVALIVRERLVYKSSLLDRLESAYQVPALAVRFAAPAQELSPAFSWRGPSEADLQLQGWFRNPPDFLDVGFLQRAIVQAASVCRIELPHLSRRGSGFLVAPGLVLTNYHVLRAEPAENLEDNARKAILRFGCLTLKSGSEDKGREFRPAGSKPIVASSPVDQLDFVLVRGEEAMASAPHLRYASISTSVPATSHGLNILQHPDGEVMKIAICANGVAHVDPVTGLIQYATAAKCGSSGSPCFNDNWEVVALHHAQRLRPWGAIREGILMASIHPRLQEHLNV